MAQLKDNRVLVAMSGGVDSSVVAAILNDRGYEVFGVTLHLWDAPGEQKVGRCCAPEDREDARRVCDALGVPHYVFDERESFRKDVVDPLLDSYLQGETPSPCVHCNRTVKLNKLLDLANTLGARYLATGHYVRIEQGAEGVSLLRGVDRAKDQSYFLYGATKETLSRLLTPLGALVKDESRALARRFGLPNADKKDSQELCFIPDGDIAGFIRKERGAQSVRPGVVRDLSGEVLGEHQGAPSYTVGQRRGLGVGGGPPRYVLRVLPESNELQVGPKEALFSAGFVARDARWLVSPSQDSMRAEVRVRYRHEPAPAVVRPDPKGFRVTFDAPQRAITPGQAAVVYRGDQVLGGGFIERVFAEGVMQQAGALSQPQRRVQDEQPPVLG